MKSFTIPSIFTAVDKFTGPVNKMATSASSFANRSERNFRNAGSAAFSMGRSAAVMGAAVITPLGLMAKAAVDFEDKMADVAKTTGLKGQGLKDFGDDLLNMAKKTRTSVDDLISVAEIGGQLGVPEKQLLSFVDSANKFNVALGKDFTGGVEEAVSQVGKIKELFKETAGKGIPISDAIMKTGSAINELGAMGAGTSANITDFTLRLGALPRALKPSLQNTLALGTHFEELGIDSQIAAGGLTNFLLVAGKNIGGFAKQMGISGQKAKEMLANDPTEFAKKFAISLNGMAPEKLAEKLDTLKVGSQETIKVIGALGSNVEKLDQLQQASAKHFADGSSVQDEYNKNNSTAAAKFAKLKNGLSSLAVTVGNTLLPVLNSLVETVSPFIEKISNWISNNRELTTTIVKIIAAVGAFALGVSAVSFAIGIYRKAAAIATIVQEAWNVAMMMNPMGLMIVAAAALAVGVYALSKAFSSETMEQRLNNEVHERALEKTIDQRTEVALLFAQLKRAKVGTDDYTNTLKKLEEIQPGIIKNYRLEAGALKDINAAEKDLIANIMKKAEMEARGEMIKEKMKEALVLKDKKATTFDKAMDWVSFGDNVKISEDLYKLQAASKMMEVEMLVKQQAEAQTKEAIDPNKKKSDDIVAGMKGNITSEVNVNITGAPNGTTATANSSSKFSTPTLSSTRK